MAIYTYKELQDAVAKYANRTDIGDVIPDFLNTAHIRIQEYTGPLGVLEEDDDTNAMTLYNPYIYVWGAMVEAADYLRDPEMRQLYFPKYMAALADLAMTGFDTIKGSANGPVV